MKDSVGGGGEEAGESRAVKRKKAKEEEEGGGDAAVIDAMRAWTGVLALGLPNRVVLYVTLKSTFRVGR